MFRKEDFDWVEFYEEFSGALLRFKKDRKGLVSIVEETFKEANLNMPTVELNNNLIDIDPFTVFGLFNKGLTRENRLKIMQPLAEKLGITAPLPQSFASIPVLDNRNATYYNFINDREPNDIDDLWELFESALNFTKSPTQENKNKLAHYFNIAVNKKGNGNSKITMGLYWIAPNDFLNLDSRNEWYIYKSGKMHSEIVSSLPTPEDKIQFDKYYEILEKLKAYLESGASELKDFKELSFEAWRYSQEVNVQTKQEKLNREHEQMLEEEHSRREPQYTEDNFLQEVYMSKENYDKLVNLLKRKKNIILQGAPGVGKTRIAKRLAYSIIGEKNTERVSMVQFHQSYSYEDFVMGFRPNAEGFELKTGIFYNFCKEAEKDEENTPYFFIVDEINRGNLSKIFGELFMLIEADKRGANASVQLVYNNERFSVPKNVHIIGMMNTADRSIAFLDYALRRRFAFYNIIPAFDNDKFKEYQSTILNANFNNLINCVKQLNEEIANDETLGSGFCIGHSYFCNLDENVDNKTLSDIVEFEIIPTLQEYWFDEKTKANEWSSKLRGCIRD